MPTYLSPGVYVEEVEAGSRPIEGVGTAVAAFVGLAARARRTRRPWSRTGASSRPTFGDFIAGSTWPTPSTATSSTAVAPAYVVRIGGDGAGGRPPRPSSPPRRTKASRLPHQRPRAGAGGDQITVEVAPTPPSRRGHVQADGPRTGQGRGGLRQRSTKSGKTNVVTVVKDAVEAHQVEEVGSGRASSRPRAGARHPRGCRDGRPMRVTPDDYVGNAADRTGFGGLEAVDEVTMLAVPDLMAVYQQGIIDLEGVQAVQLAMIAHCELMGDRVAILDAPPGLQRPADQGVAGRQGRLRLQVRVALLAVGQGLRPARRHGRRSCRRAATWPASGPGATTRGASTRRRRTRSSAARSASSSSITKGEHDQLNPHGHQLHPCVPRPRHPGLGRPDAVERSGLALPQRPPALQLHRGVHPRGHPVGGLRAERPRPVGARQAHDQRVPPGRLARRRAVRRDAEEAFYVKCDAETNPPDVVDRGQLIVEIGIAPVKPAEFVIFRIAQFSGGAALSE